MDTPSVVAPVATLTSPRRRWVRWLVVIVVIGGILVWWFVKFPRAYGAYMLRGVYYKTASQVPAQDAANIPNASLASLVFGTDATVVSSYGGATDFATNHADTQGMVIHVTNAPDAIFDEYHTYFSDAHWVIDASDPSQRTISAHNTLSVTVAVSPDNANGSNVHISLQP